jgi:tetratricopeptide (TPR) repeat protein
MLLVAGLVAAGTASASAPSPVVSPVADPPRAAPLVSAPARLEPSVSAPAPTAVPAQRLKRTTHGAIALANLESQIAGLERAAERHAISPGEGASLAGLRLQRAQILGRVSDYEAALALGDALVRDHPHEPRGWLVRARAAAALHRFPAALADLGEAARRGAAPAEIDAVRAGVLQATGRLDEALEIRRRLVAARRDVTSLGGEGTVRAARGELREAERLYAAAVASYQDVSPFPVAWVELQRGLMWMREDDLPRARIWLATAHERLPQYAPAAGHLAEVEAALGRVDAAVALLRPLAERAEDPDYAAQLARILGEAGRAEEAARWRDRAVARYETLLAEHPEAFADHAAELWLAAGDDPARALVWAERNLEIRPTVRAWELVLRAAEAAGNEARACAAAAGARAAGYVPASARAVVDAASERCAGRVPAAPPRSDPPPPP